MRWVFLLGLVVFGCGEVTFDMTPTQQAIVNMDAASTPRGGNDEEQDNESAGGFDASVRGVSQTEPEPSSSPSELPSVPSPEPSVNGDGPDSGDDKESNDDDHPDHHENENVFCDGGPCPGQCFGHDDCADSTPYCDTTFFSESFGTCVGCRFSEDCLCLTGREQAVCGESKTCRGCRDGECLPGFECHHGVCERDCFNERDCPGGWDCENGVCRKEINEEFCALGAYP